MHRPEGVTVLSGNYNYKNKNIDDNGSGSETHSELIADSLTDEISGILSFNRLSRRIEGIGALYLSGVPTPFYPVLNKSD